jgi:hypothetical protein
MEHRTRQGKLTVLVWIAGLLTAAAGWSTGQVTGTYLGNGKEAKLAYALVVPHKPFDGEAAYTIILSEKNPAGVEKPDFDAMFGKLGHALVISVTRKGEIFSTQVCHQALAKSGFSSVGPLLVENFKIEGKQLSGRFYTKKEDEFFGDKWQADLTVKAALP